MQSAAAMREKSGSLHARIRSPSNPGRATVLAFGTILALSSGGASAADTTVIDLAYDAAMDMVRPERRPGILVHHNLEITLSDQNALSEQRNRVVRPYADQNATAQVLGSSGDAATYASWHTAPDGRLVRVQNDPQSTRTMTVTLLPGHACRLDVADELKPGFSEYAFLRVSTHTIGYFSSYRVTSTSCTIR